MESRQQYPGVTRGSKFASPSFLLKCILPFKHDAVRYGSLGHERPDIVREVPVAGTMLGNMQPEPDRSLRIVAGYVDRVVRRAASARTRGHSEKHVAIEVDLWLRASFRPAERQH